MDFIVTLYDESVHLWTAKFTQTLNPSNIRTLQLLDKTSPSICGLATLIKLQVELAILIQP